jgi:hypothetical protein
MSNAQSSLAPRFTRLRNSLLAISSSPSCSETTAYFQLSSAVQSEGRIVTAIREPKAGCASRFDSPGSVVLPSVQRTSLLHTVACQCSVYDTSICSTHPSCFSTLPPLLYHHTQFYSVTTCGSPHSFLLSLPSQGSHHILSGSSSSSTVMAINSPIARHVQGRRHTRKILRDNIKAISKHIDS